MRSEQVKDLQDVIMGHVIRKKSPVTILELIGHVAPGWNASDARYAILLLIEEGRLCLGDNNVLTTEERAMSQPLTPALIAEQLAICDATPRWLDADHPLKEALGVFLESARAHYRAALEMAARVEEFLGSSHFKDYVHRKYLESENARLREALGMYRIMPMTMMIAIIRLVATCGERARKALGE